ncbi:MAG: CoA transferase, partial [Desulfarculaceae bacterium]|nr:CoA transferase [Desulfarculaceae bacterium]
AAPTAESRTAVLNRGKKSLAIDLKHPLAAGVILKMVEQADGLIEGFRPGVMEKLGLGPTECLARNPRLIFGRMTGWGQEGPLSQRAGHDINYIALSGALNCMGRRDQRPVPPLNLVGDFGGGGMYLAFGMVCALLERERSGQGQVIDAAIVDGAASLLSMIHWYVAAGRWSLEREDNALDGAAPFYDTYETADGLYISLGSIEPQFYATMLRLLEIEGVELSEQRNKQTWGELKARIAAKVRQKTREQWCRLLEEHDVCFAPVLGLYEAPEHPHNRARGTFVEIEGVMQAAPAPRFSRTNPPVPAPPPEPGGDTLDLLSRFGFRTQEIERLQGERVV